MPACGRIARRLGGWERSQVDGETEETRHSNGASWINLVRIGPILSDYRSVIVHQQGLRANKLVKVAQNQYVIVNIRDQRMRAVVDRMGAHLLGIGPVPPPGSCGCSPPERMLQSRGCRRLAHPR